MLEFSVVELKLGEMVKLGCLLKYQDCLLSVIIKNKTERELFKGNIQGSIFFSLKILPKQVRLLKTVQFFYLGQILPQFTQIIKNLGMNLWIHYAVDISQNS